MILPGNRIDGVPVDNLLTQAVRAAIKPAPARQDNFWSTPERRQEDATIEVLEVSLNGLRRINYLNFDTAHFPHTVTAEWWDADAEAWLPVRSSNASRDWKTLVVDGDTSALSPSALGDPVWYQVGDSAPVKVNTATTQGISLGVSSHPQHFGAGHWVPVTWRLNPISTSRIRLLFIRGGGTPPADVMGHPAPYSLGVRDLQVGYRVNARNDVPTAAALTEEAFGSSVDLLGSRVLFGLREQKAINVLADGEGKAWRSEPQPVNYSVVNLYVDTRTGPQDPATGQPLVDDVLRQPTRLRPDAAVVGDDSDATFLDEAAATRPVDADAGRITTTVLPTAGTLSVRASWPVDAIPPYKVRFSHSGADPSTGTIVGVLTDTALATGAQVFSAPLDDLAPLAAGGTAPYVFTLEFAGDPSYPGSGSKLFDWWIDADLPDSRSADELRAGGQGQVIDRFWVDPLTVGAHVNLYYSNDTPTGRYAALDEPLNYPLSQTHGSAISGSLDPLIVENGVVRFATTQTSYVDIDNAYLQFNPAKPWWLGLAFRSSHGVDGVVEGESVHPWLSFGGNTLRLNGSAIEFITASGKSVAVGLDPEHMVNTPYTAAVVFNTTDDGDHPAGLTLVYRMADREPVEVTQHDITARDFGPRPGVLGLGRNNDPADPGIPAMFLRALVLKTDAQPTHGEVRDVFTAVPEAFVTTPEAGLDTGLSDNALLRLHASYAVSGVNPVGLIGGPGDRYAEMTWTPVHRDYVLKRGFMHLPPTRAKYWKFEFTQLVAEHYESFVPIRRTVKLFPATVVSQHQATTSGTTFTLGTNPGVQTAMDLTDLNRYSDAVSALQQASSSDLTHTATEALYVRDPSQAERIKPLGWVWNYQPWHIGTSAPRFSFTQTHRYETVTVEHKSKVGFFAGIKTLTAYRVDYLVDDDTEQYIEHFHDQVNIAEMDSVTVGDNQLSAYANGGSATSKTFLSTRPVRGVQFASIQSDAYSLLEDDGFVADDLFAHWDDYGDATLTRLEDRDVLVNRGWRARHWGDLEKTFDPDGDGVFSYGELDGHLFGELEGDLPNGQAGGGIISERATPSQSGRVYASAKVSATDTLSGPIRLEIVSVEGNVVLASAERYVAAGEEEVFFIGYSVGTALSALTYGDIETPARVSKNVTLTAYSYLYVDLGSRSLDPTAIEVRLADGTLLIQGTDYSTPYWNDSTSAQIAFYPYSNYPDGPGTVSWSAPPTYGSLQGTTYGDHETRPIEGDVYARLTQPGRFADQFLVKRLSLFDASVTWEFSNDGGAHWFDGMDVRNNPEGVLMFPAQGNQLRWRMRTFRPGASVSALAIRPWYGGLLGAVPHHTGTHVLGPNLSAVDIYPDVHQDPMWQVSDSPIPAGWFQPPKVLPAPVPPPPPPPPPPIPDYSVAAQTVLMDTIAENQYYDSAQGKYVPLPNPDENYAFGPTATAILDDGTVFVAVQVDRNIYQHSGSDGTANTDTEADDIYNGGFLRMWHLDKDLTVLGQTDMPWTTMVDFGGNQIPWALAVNGTKVTVVVDSPFDSASDRSVQAKNRGFDTGTGFDFTNPPADTTLTWYGSDATLDRSASYGNAPSSWNQIDATNTAALAAANIQDPQKANIKHGAQALLVRMTASFWAEVSNMPAARWRLYDNRLGYADGLIASGTGMPGAIQTYGPEENSSRYTAGTWREFQWTLPLDATALAKVLDCQLNDSLVVAFDPADSGVRRVSSIGLSVTTGIDFSN